MQPSRSSDRLAVLAETLYLLNLLVLPGIGFLLLWILYSRTASDASAVASNHFRQTLSASVWAGILLLIVSIVLVTTGNLQGPYLWVFLIPYFTLVHSGFILLGILGLIKALAGETVHFPVVGKKLS